MNSVEQEQQRHYMSHYIGISVLSKDTKNWQIDCINDQKYFSFQTISQEKINAGT